MQKIDNETDIAEGLAHLAQLDFRFGKAIEMAGPVPLRRRPPGYEALSEIIVSQMVSKASANALMHKLRTSIGEITPVSMLALDDAGARAAGLSGAKITTLRLVAEAVLSGRLDLEHLCTVPAKDALAAMTAIKGVGPWTAEVYLLFCAGHADIFPSGDVALQSAAAHVFELETRPASKALARIAQGWSPWRGVAARLLWAYYAAQMRRDALPLGG